MSICATAHIGKKNPQRRLSLIYVCSSSFPPAPAFLFLLAGHHPPDHALHLPYLYPSLQSLVPFIRLAAPTLELPHNATDGPTWAGPSGGMATLQLFIAVDLFS